MDPRLDDSTSRDSDSKLLHSRLVYFPVKKRARKSGSIRGGGVACMCGHLVSVAVVMRPAQSMSTFVYANPPFAAHTPALALLEPTLAFNRLSRGLT